MRIRQFASDGARAFPGAAGLLHLEGVPPQLGEDRAPAGIGRSAARLVATDGDGPHVTRGARAGDRADRAAGCVPVLIVASAGTTNAGMIDPLSDCAETRAHATGSGTTSTPPGAAR